MGGLGLNPGCVRKGIQCKTCAKLIIRVNATAVTLNKEQLKRKLLTSDVSAVRMDLQGNIS